MKVHEFEDAVWAKDGVRVVVRAPNAAVVLDYKNANAASGTLSVTNYIKNRISPNVARYECAVVAGDGSVPHGRTKISKIRETY